MSMPNPTHEWRRIKTMDEAYAVARAARTAKDPHAVRKAKAARKNKTHGVENGPVTGVETTPTETHSHGGETTPTSLGGKTHPTSIFPVKVLH